MNRLCPSTPRLLAWSRVSLIALLFLVYTGSGIAQSYAYTSAIGACLYQTELPPPINLTALSAQPSGRSHILLEWTTEGERDNNYFEIERSEDGIHFAVVGRVTGRSTTSRAEEYNFFDYYPKSGAAHYRLRQISFCGSTYTTREIALRTDPSVRRSLPTLPAIGTGAYAYGLLAAN